MESIKYDIREVRGDISRLSSIISTIVGSEIMKNVSDKRITINSDITVRDREIFDYQTSDTVRMSNIIKNIEELEDLVDEVVEDEDFKQDCLDVFEIIDNYDDVFLHCLGTVTTTAIPVDTRGYNFIVFEVVFDKVSLSENHPSNEYYDSVSGRTLVNVNDDKAIKDRIEISREHSDKIRSVIDAMDEKVKLSEKGVEEMEDLLKENLVAAEL
jgi:hypothetical protein